jgi:uncharacterized protein YceH (UPF0502 family)
LETQNNASSGPRLTLDPIEARVLGVLVEKDLTTPDQYPMTLNGVTLGCNQKSNRDPVMNLMEGEVNAALGKLIVKGLAGSVHPMGSRVEKFRHNMEAVLKIGTPQAALLAELLMRGPQQPGELRSRVSRMTSVDTLAALMEIMKPLLDSGQVVRLDPTPGSRAERYAQTIAPDAHPIDVRAHAVARPMSSAPPGAMPQPKPHNVPQFTSMPSFGAPEPVPAFDAEPLVKRIDDLEFQVRTLRRQLDALAWKLGQKLEG